MAKKIEGNIKIPGFRDHDYVITKFGAVTGADARNAINKAITSCNVEGGGRVVIPAGKYLVNGPIVLKSHVNLYLQKDAELIFSSKPEHYLPVVFTRWEGTEVYNYSPLIYARKASDIAITGEGKLNGMGSETFNKWKSIQQNDQKALREMGRNGVPVQQRVFGKGHFLRPAFIELVECNNIFIEGLSIVNSPFWIIHPIYCNNVTVRGVNINSKNFNSDGCDPESSTNVLIENCHFITGDDGIAIKSGRDNDGWRVGKPTENIIIRNCIFESETNGTCIGSEISGGVRNVFIENIQVPKASNAIYFKSNLDRGGFIEHVRIRNVHADSMKSAAVKIEPDYKSEQSQYHPTRFQDFVIEDVSCNYSKEYGIDLRGFVYMPVQNITLRNVDVKKAQKTTRIENAQTVSIVKSTVNGQPVPYETANKKVSLNGIWNVAISETKPATFISKVAVPGVITSAKPKLGEDLDGVDHTSIPYNYVWYQYTFNLNEPSFPRAILKLRAKYNAQVWVNGTEIGYDPYSTYSHGEFDISRALKLTGSNDLVVRIGSWNTSTAPSKENSAEWWRNSRAPGIWDDVEIELGQEVSTDHAKILPDTKQQVTKCEIEVGNHSNTNADVEIIASILDNGKMVSTTKGNASIKPGETSVYKTELPSQLLQFWTAGKEGSPKMYSVNIKVQNKEGKILSNKNIPFGYRNIEVKGKDVLLNGKKIYFRAENVVFDRALNRWPEVVFDEQWIRKFLRAAIHDYNFNYLRIHLGHAYNKWYDIADQEGIMLHDEWRYMHDDEPEGKEKEEAGIEFMRWIRENVNHPSIVVWDQENEGNVRLVDLKKKIREYDPTRLWEDDDFDATHNYRYSETIVPTPGYPLSDTKPTTVLEACRLWPNENGLLEPRENFKTSRTSTGWGVFYYTKDLMQQMQADIHADQGTYARETRMQAWCPFALLSGWVNGQNSFQGNLADSMSPKPSLLVLQKINEPIGSSIDMLQAHEWYKDKKTYQPGGDFKKQIISWNDFSEDVNATLTLNVKNGYGKILSSKQTTVFIPAYQATKTEMSFTAPKTTGVYFIEPVLKLKDGKQIKGVTRRIMVASKNDQSVEGLMGFGGSRKPIKGGQSIIEHFLGHSLPAKLEQAIITTVGNNSLLDKLTLEDDNKICVVQTTVYLSETRTVVTNTKLDVNGKVLSKQQSEAMNYVDLPASIKTIVNQAIGSVPVDESKMTKTMKGSDTVYEITVVGSDSRHRLVIAPDGTLKDRETIKKGDKNRIKN